MLVRNNQMTELAMLASICTPPSAIQIKYPAENNAVHDELNANIINLDKCTKCEQHQWQEAGSQRVVSGAGPCPIIISLSYEKCGQTKFGHRNASH